MKKYFVLLILFIAGFVCSGIKPHDYFTWILETFPAIIGCLIIILTFKKFRFTYFAYTLMLIHSYILFVGGHYTYAEVPLFDWLRDTLHQSRNNYDKLGHLFQGFVPAIISREIFIRKEIIKRGGWLSFLTVCVCMFISVMYEFIEWLVAVLTGTSADSFLGTQGYIWDTQSDMLFAFIGSLCMLIFLSGIHNRQIDKLQINANSKK